ncbi:hypothetical protein LEP1GSC127_1717 [Leptospira kirschneri str. 200801925]|nr:hypothetical protein LEP1GSC127_1717 [Leptospira kirschneri str. 200801925]EPG50470.1 hypothetical protein LEP1GSC049_3467 [Leptospira kirschneri serovar Cynopteri str. 3522 CT]
MSSFIDPFRIHSRYLKVTVDFCENLVFLQILFNPKFTFFCRDPAF